MGAFADHSADTTPTRPLLKDLKSLRTNLSNIERLGHTAFQKERREHDRAADMIRSHCGDRCLKCGHIDFERFEDPLEMKTTIAVRCNTPRACPHDQPEWREVVGMDGRIVVQPGTPGEPVFRTDPDWEKVKAKAKLDAAIDDGKRHQDWFKREYMTMPKEKAPTPRNPDRPLTVAGDGW
jgi:hypothetical protein